MRPKNRAQVIGLYKGMLSASRPRSGLREARNAPRARDHLTNPNTRPQHSAPPATRPRTNYAKCSLRAKDANRERENLSSGQAAPSKMGGKPANWNPGGGTNLLRLGVDHSRPRGTRKERQAPGSGGQPGWASEPGVPLSGPRADSHSRGCGPGSAGLGADCTARGRQRREETPSPALRPGPGSTAPYSRWLHGSRLRAGQARARDAGARWGGLARTAGRTEESWEAGHDH